MGVKERREREKLAVRKEILDAARELFLKEGYESVSMRKIADKIEYSPTTIYLYFDDKAQLVHSLCEEAFVKLVKMFETLGGDLSDPVSALKKCGRAYIEFGLKYPNDYKVTFMLNLRPDKSPEEYLREDSMGMRAYGYLRKIVEECVRQGKFHGADVETTTQTVWIVVHGVTSLLIAHPKFPWVDRECLIDFTIEKIVNGLSG
ncbi:MAG TPA: TetR/AcrR family transcriptional regulator [Thermodesulfobacteriota bacterium]|nr:TetR/AcrR family transcriptional regulator [Thermodesulfobacteriota bacterium]